MTTTKCQERKGQRLLQNEQKTYDAREDVDFYFWRTAERKLTSRKMQMSISEGPLREGMPQWRRRLQPWRTAERRMMPGYSRCPPPKEGWDKEDVDVHPWRTRERAKMPMKLQTAPAGLLRWPWCPGVCGSLLLQSGRMMIQGPFYKLPRSGPQPF